MRKFTKLTSVIVACVASITIPATAHADQPQHGKDMVTFGDSFTANGGAPGGRGRTSPYPRPIRPCFNDNDNWAHQTARNLGMSLADYSCNGTSDWVNNYVDHALLSGEIGPDTKEVAFMYGGLQPSTYIDAALPDIPKASAYRGLLAHQFNKIRAKAPHARITMVNYIPMTVNDTLCAVNDGNKVIPIGFPGVTGYEDRFNAEIGHAARDLGVNFIDLHNQAKTHDPCQPDTSQRWAVAAKTPVAPSVMPMHPTDVGHTGMAGIITRELRR